MYSAFNDFPSWSLDKSSSILERASLLSCRMSLLKCLVCPMKSALRSTTRYLNTRRSYAKDYEACVRGWFPTMPVTANSVNRGNGAATDWPFAKLTLSGRWLLSWAPVANVLALRECLQRLFHGHQHRCLDQG